MGTWSGVLLTWLVLMSLSVSRARFLITTELSSCITITESPWHLKRGDDGVRDSVYVYLSQLNYHHVSQ